MPLSVPPPLPPAPAKTWWNRNWWWLAGLGGLALLMAFSLLTLQGMKWVYRRVKESEGYRVALATVRADQRVVAALGEPIEDEDVVTGSFTNGTNMHFVFATVPLKGPKGRATMTLNATKTDGLWQFNALSVIVQSTHQVIDLRAAANGSHVRSGHP